MGKLIYLTCIVFISGFVRVNSLQCYQCEDCATVKDEHIVTCGATTTAVPTTTPTATTPGQTTEPGQTTTPGQTTVTGQSTTPGQTESPTTTVAVATQTETTATTTTLAPGQQEANEAYLPRMRRSVFVQPKADEEYVCAVVKYKENNADKVSRGCAPSEAAVTQLCETLAVVNATCTSCNTDLCNSAICLQTSVLIVLTSILYLFIQK